jgi:hypothetical protein
MYYKSNSLTKTRIYSIYRKSWNRWRIVTARPSNVNLSTFKQIRFLCVCQYHGKTRGPVYTETHTYPYILVGGWHWWGTNNQICRKKVLERSIKSSCYNNKQQFLSCCYNRSILTYYLPSERVIPKIKRLGCIRWTFSSMYTKPDNKQARDYLSIAHLSRYIGSTT